MDQILTYVYLQFEASKMTPMYHAYYGRKWLAHKYCLVKAAITIITRILPSLYVGWGEFVHALKIIIYI